MRFNRQTVSIHAPARGATQVPRTGCCTLLKFQSTPPRGGRRGLRTPYSHRQNSFNPRPRAGGDCDSRTITKLSISVSIHAPARGATRSCISYGQPYQFQSTPPRGGRLGVRAVDRRRIPVSIHAPARGATRRSSLAAPVSRFQSTPPRGGRHRSYCLINRAVGCFNPRPRAGGDGITARVRQHGLEVSIHAPARGATAVYQYRSNSLSYVSIHAPARGATWTRDRVWHCMTCVSIHAPARGATIVRCLQAADGQWVSIHAPARGATPALGKIVPDYLDKFQSTPPRGGRLARTAATISHWGCFNPRPRAGGD